MSDLVPVRTRKLAGIADVDAVHGAVLGVLGLALGVFCSFNGDEILAGMAGGTGAALLGGSRIRRWRRICRGLFNRLPGGDYVLMSHRDFAKLMEKVPHQTSSDPFRVGAEDDGIDVFDVRIK